MFDDLKKKIKETGIESKKYIADPNHPYHEATGLLKIQIICGYIGIALLTIYSIVLIYYFFKYDFASIIKLAGRYLGIAGTFITVLLVIYAVIYILLFAFCVIFFNKLKNKETDFLLFYHNMCVACYVLSFVLLFFDFKDTFFRIIWFTILVAIFTYYYCTSVKVRVYFGGDEFLKKDHYIHFLLDGLNYEKTNITPVVNKLNDEILNSQNDKKIYANNNTTNFINLNVDEVKKEDSNTNNTNIIESKNSDAETINTTEFLKAFTDIPQEDHKEDIIENDIKKDDIDNNVVKNNVVNNAQQTAKLSTNPNKKVTSKSVAKPTQSKQNENIDRVRVDNNHNFKRNCSKKKSNPFVKFLKFLLSTIIKLILLIIIVLTLINYNNKYKITDAPFFKNIFNVVDNVTSNLFVRNSNNIKNTKETAISEQVEKDQTVKKQVNKDQISNSKGENVKAPAKEVENSETSNDNNIASTLDHNVDTIEKVSHDAVKLSTNIKKINLKGAKWQFNNKQNAWNLIINDKVSKNVIYIIDYTNPITGEPCSSTYGFDPNGKMIVGWGIDESNNYYYFDDNTYDIGKMCTGWKEIDGHEYYFESNGRLLTDAITPDGNHVDTNGRKKVDNNTKKSKSEGNKKIDNYYNKSTR